jgi:glc operon protein GlcG
VAFFASGVGLYVLGIESLGGKPNMDEFRTTIHNLTLAGAKCVLRRAQAEASKLGLSVSVVVVNRSGVLLLVETDDNAAPGAPEASIMKARGTARYRIATHKTAEYLKNLPPQMAQHALSLPEACAFQGGVPIQIEGEVIGGVGVSGGSGEQDIGVASAAAASVA